MLLCSFTLPAHLIAALSMSKFSQEGVTLVTAVCNILDLYARSWIKNR